VSQQANQNPGRSGGSTSAKPVVFTTGIVSQVDDKKGWARCKLPDMDNLETFWLKVLQRNTKDNQVYWMPDVDEQVMIICDENLEEGCILGAIYSEADKPPVDKRDKYHVKWKADPESFFEFDREESTLTIKCKKIVIELEENMLVTNQQESKINNKAIAVIGAMDNDSESNGADALVTSGQL